MKPDPAVTEILGLNHENVSETPYGGSGCSSASTAKIVFRLADGTEKQFFIKSGSGKDAELMFKGEHTSLNALHNAVPSLCPKSYGWGNFQSQPSTSFVVTDFLTSTSRRPSIAPKAMSLAEKLAKLHTIPAPVPEGYKTPMFGFPVTTCCGDTPQDNSFKSSWADFYANNRLRYILRQAESSNGSDAEFYRMVETTASIVVPRLLGDDHLKDVYPVVVHGDLWPGNASHGVIGGEGDAEDVVYDPSSCYAHSEYELGIMRMFGGFGGNFLMEYHKICPKTEPIGEYEDRIALYEFPDIITSTTTRYLVGGINQEPRAL